MAKDPVCAMIVDDNSARRSTHAGQTYAFCSASCQARFEKEPGRYTASAGSGALPGGNEL